MNDEPIGLEAYVVIVRSHNRYVWWWCWVMFLPSNCLLKNHPSVRCGGRTTSPDDLTLT